MQTDSIEPRHRQAEPFSGEIVFRQRWVAKESTQPTTELPNFHYFVSGRHWKRTLDDGTVLVQFDPDTFTTHMFEDGYRAIDARESPGSYRFERVSETKTILDRTCAGYRMVTDQFVLVEYYAPNLFVRLQDRRNHRAGYWEPRLRRSGGQLGLWMSYEFEDRTLIEEAISVERKTFEPGFWDLPDLPEAL